MESHALMTRKIGPRASAGHASSLRGSDVIVRLGLSVPGALFPWRSFPQPLGLVARSTLRAPSN